MWLWLLLLLLLVCIIAFLYYSALLTPVTIHRLPSQRLRVAYVLNVGPYTEAYKRHCELERDLAKIRPIDWSKEPCFGVYFDVPTVTEASKCRALVGKVIPDDLEERELENIRFGYMEPMADTLQVRYPLRSVLCIFAAIYRVYPKITKFWDSEGKDTPRSAMVEFYGLHGQTITFMQGIGQAEGILNEWPAE
jgi:hypothetical protein